LQVFVEPQKVAQTVEKLVQDAGGYLPRVSARAVCLVLAERLGTAEREEERERQDEDAETIQPDTDAEDIQVGIQPIVEGSSVDPTTEGVTDGSDAGEVEGADAAGGEGAD